MAGFAFHFDTAARRFDDHFGDSQTQAGARLVEHARYYWLMPAESHLTRRLLAAMVRRIAALAVATG